jgi:zona occludens toxin (predicted ATPase)
MITGYVGLPGSGKSFSVVKHQILPALKAGRDVVTNLPLILPEIEKLGLPGEVTIFDIDVIVAEPHRISEYAKPGCVLVIDEAWKMLPAGMQAVDIAPEWKSLFTEHRHMVNARGDSMQIVLVVQDLALMSAFARKLVGETFVTTKLSMVGLSKSYRVDMFHGSVNGCTPNPKRAVRQMPGRYTSDIQQLYKSHTMSESGSLGANEARVDGRMNILRRPVFMVGAVAVPLMLWFCFHTLGKFLHHEKPVPVASSPVGAAPRSGAERGSPAAVVAAAGAGVRGPRLVLEVVVGVGGASGLIADGGRLVSVLGDDCRRVSGQLQCRYRSVWYDAMGAVESAVVALPIGSYNSALVRR